MNQFIRHIREMSLPNKYTKWYCNIIEKALDRASTRKEAKALLDYCEGHHIVPKCIEPNFKNEKSNLAFLSAREHFICHRLLTKMFSGQEKYKMSHALFRFSQNTSSDRPTLTASQYASAIRAKAQGHTEETKLRIKTTKQTTPLLECPYCGVFSNPGNAKQHHFDNCLLGPNPDAVRELRKQKAKTFKQSWHETERDIITCPHCQTKSLFADKMKRFHFENCPTLITPSQKPKRKANNSLIVCPHCEEIGTRSTMYRNHFNHCPKKMIISDSK